MDLKLLKDVNHFVQDLVIGLDQEEEQQDVDGNVNGGESGIRTHGRIAPSQL